MDKYQSPFNSRYASPEMSYLFSDLKKFTTWRLLWITLAKAQKKLGLNITNEQIEELERFKNDINIEVAKQKEKEVRHDVMAHIHAYGEQARLARPIIHLGATSCYVGDNTDIIIMREALLLILAKLASVIKKLSDFSLKYKDMPQLAFTHFQPAQLTTVGKRATLWIQDLMMDLEEVDHVLQNMKLLGSKGTTGTQASFLELFDNNEEKVKELEVIIAKELDFKEVYPVSGQTYPRKLDAMILNVLSGIAQSAHKFSNDIRLLQHKKEIEEPFEKSQIGSSAMAYKRNPMRTERMTGLSRFVIANAQNGALTASEQWFERTLDDSSNKRLAIAEGFLAVDSILNIFTNVAEGLVVYPKVIEKHIEEELPFMATENIIMHAVKLGGDRQDLHEHIRVHSMEASRVVKVFGLKNDLLERIAKDPIFGMSKEELLNVLDPKKYIGRSISQVSEYIENIVLPKISKYNTKVTETELTV